MNSVIPSTRSASPRTKKARLAYKASPLERHQHRLETDSAYAEAYAADPETFHEEIEVEQSSWDAKQAAARAACERKEASACLAYAVEREHRETAFNEDSERIEAAWRASLLAAWGDEPPPPTTPASVFDATGEAWGLQPAGLEDFAEHVGCLSAIRRHGADDLTRMLRWHAEQDGAPLIAPHDGSECRHEDYIKKPRHWAVAIDQDRVVPPGLCGAALAAWCAKWRDSIPPLEGTELAVYAAPGENPVFVTWWETPLSDSDVCAWCRRISGDSDEPRFWPPKYPWCPPSDAVYLPSAHAAPAAVALPKASTLARVTPATKLLTGIGALDGQFRGLPGIPLGARVVLIGDRENCKTLLLLEIAEGALAAGWGVVWFAFDEPAEKIIIRRLQRRGLTPEAAEALPAAELAALDAQPFYIADGATTLEAAWETAHGCAEGRPLLVIGDSLQTLRSQAAEGRGEREGLEAMLASVQECQRRWPAAFVASSEKARGSGQAKGSGRIDYAATTILGVSLAGDRLDVTPQKNRDGRKVPFALTADFDRQRLLDVTQAAKAAARLELRTEIRTALGELGGCASGAKIESRVSAMSDRVRAELRGMAADGELIKTPKGYRLP